MNIAIHKDKMKKTLVLVSVTLAIIGTTFMTGISEQPLLEEALAQVNSSSAGTSSTDESTSLPNKTTTDAAKTNFLKYENSSWGISMEYPSSWVKQTAGQGVAFVVLPHGMNDNNNTSQKFLAKLNVTSIAGIPPNAPLKALADRVVDGYRHLLPNFQIESYTNSTLGGNNAIKIVYSYIDAGNTHFKATDIATTKNDRLYVIQYYYAQSPNDQSYLQTLEKMVASFKL